MPSYYTATQYGDMHIKGDLGPHCADCADVGGILCDYPIGGGLTCDRSLCEAHGHIVGEDIHYCETHYREWRANNPEAPTEYALTRYRLKTLPGQAEVALGFLKDAFESRDPGHRDEHLARFLRSSAIPLGRDAQRVGHGPIDDEPHESLAGGLAWCIEHGLAQVCWRKPAGHAEQPWFALTPAGLAVMEGEVVEAVRDEGNP